MEPTLESVCVHGGGVLLREPDHEQVNEQDGVR